MSLSQSRLPPLLLPALRTDDNVRGGSGGVTLRVHGDPPIGRPGSREGCNPTAGSARSLGVPLLYVRLCNECGHIEGGGRGDTRYASASRGWAPTRYPPPQRPATVACRFAPES